jgi:hypothetical protein
MSADFAHELTQRHEEAADARESLSRTARARIVLAIGPVTALGGVIWAVLQPWRLTLLHPGGQGVWWLLAEPQLYVIAVGVVFRLVVAPGVADDLLEDER